MYEESCIKYSNVSYENKNCSYICTYLIVCNHFHELDVNAKILTLEPLKNY